jgi:phytoene dehydrogenase-like protein
LLGLNFEYILKVLDKWFESEPLKATLATDAVIGAMISPETPGSGSVVLLLYCNDFIDGLNIAIIISPRNHFEGHSQGI